MQLLNLDNINKSMQEGDFTMDSHEFLNTVINKVRKENGEEGLRHNQFIKQIEDEFSKQISVGAGPLGYQKMVAQENGNGRSEFLVYELNYKQMVIMGMRSSKVVREIVYDLLVELKNKHDAAIRELLNLQESTLKSNRFLNAAKSDESELRDILVVSAFKFATETGNWKMALETMNKNPHLTKHLLELTGYSPD